VTSCSPTAERRGCHLLCGKTAAYAAVVSNLPILPPLIPLPSRGASYHFAHTLTTHILEICHVQFVVDSTTLANLNLGCKTACVSAAQSEADGTPTLSDCHLTCLTTHRSVPHCPAACLVIAMILCLEFICLALRAKLYSAVRPCTKTDTIYSGLNASAMSGNESRLRITAP